MNRSILRYLEMIFNGHAITHAKLDTILGLIGDAGEAPASLELVNLANRLTLEAERMTTLADKLTAIAKGE